ncbi:hypothetical protein GCM10027051_09980 [Niabella terrae]
MKQALLIVNALLVIAVSFLLFREFSGNQNVSAVAAPHGKDSANAGKVLIAYINMDSIQNKYQLAKEAQAEVEKKREAMNAELNRMEKNYRTKLDGYQKKAPTMTEQEADAARRDMENTMRQMGERKQSLEEEFGHWLSSKNLSVMKDIQEYLKKFNARGAYSFIFSYEPGLFYYSDTAYDITSQVLNGLNDSYKQRKK